MVRNSRGRFIVFEGIDGAGSTTQVHLLFNFLRQKKISVVETAEPTDSFIGLQIRSILQGKAKVSPKAFQLLYCADRENHLDNEVVPALKLGKAVLCDRYYYSTIAYGGLNLDKKWLLDITKDFLKPDVTFYIDTPVKVAMERMKNRKSREFFEKEKWLREVSGNYLKLMKNDKICVVLDGTKSRQQIFGEVLEILKKKKIV